jgi:tellurite resistance protein TerC
MLLLWIGFITTVLVLIALDLFVFHRHDEVMSVKSALRWSAFWCALALGFGGCIYYLYQNHVEGLGLAATTAHPAGISTGWDALSIFLTGYVLELSLSVDNLFVIAVIFGYFAVPSKFQHRVLFWGIIGVLIMRGGMIGIGAGLIRKFGWVLYVFGAILLYTAYKMLFGGGDEADPRNNPILKLARRYFPVTQHFYGPRFLIREGDLDTDDAQRPQALAVVTDGPTPVAESAMPTSPMAAPPVAKEALRAARGGWYLTPLALALIVVETTDLVFAVDSIPAIFAITDDPFLVFTSNVCAVLGLRSLFFALAGILQKFEYLKVSLAIILALIGLKMLGHHWLAGIKHINYYTLGVVGLLLAAGVTMSLMSPAKPESGTSESHSS